jgi:general secretion pathway protein A
MYTAFYGLREKPFSLTPNPRFLYLADSHREAMAHLLYGLEQGEGFIVITGEVGTGKTTLCRSLLERLDAQTEVGILFNPSRNANELLESVNEEFGLPVEGRSRRQLLSSINRFLLEKSHVGSRVVLIVDEAQNLSPGTLEQVRLLSNLETASKKLIQIILLGQPELDAKLDSESLRQLRQRVSVRWGLEPLPTADTIGYVRHRLNVAAGAQREIFTGAALREVHRLTRGVPRLINVLCDRALLAGYGDEAHRIGPKLVRRAASEVPGIVSPRRPTDWLRGRTWQIGAGVVLLGFALGLLDGGNLVRGWHARVVGEAPAERVADRGALPDVSSRPESIGHYPGEPRAEGAGVLTLSIPLPDPATPLRADERSMGVPGAAAPAGEADDRFDANASETGRGDFLAALLSGRDAPLDAAAATDAILVVFGEPSAEGSVASLDEAVEAIAAGPLSVLALEETDFDTLRMLDRPALITLLDNLGEPHVVALVGLDRGLAELRGVGTSGVLRVPLGDVEERWAGDAHVVWRPAGAIPEILVFGDTGAGVLWLQEGLTRQGSIERGISGTYDQRTVEGVQTFQRQQGLIPDGVAGPMTQILLSGQLGDGAAPRLQRGDAG